jgi:hypothetical protein
MESTSNIFAYGSAMFYATAHPSNTFDILDHDFNHSQLLVIIMMLVGSIFVLNQLIKKKKTKEAWQ